MIQCFLKTSIINKNKPEYGLRYLEKNFIIEHQIKEGCELYFNYSYEKKHEKDNSIKEEYYDFEISFIAKNVSYKIEFYCESGGTEQKNIIQIINTDSIIAEEYEDYFEKIKFLHKLGFYTLQTDSITEGKNV